MAQGSEYAVGTIVKLKSGGPEMTIQSKRDLTLDKFLYRCQWFAGKKLESGEFPPDSLEVVPTQTKAP